MKRTCIAPPPAHGALRAVAVLLPLTTLLLTSSAAFAADKPAEKPPAAPAPTAAPPSEAPPAEAPPPAPAEELPPPPPPEPYVQHLTGEAYPDHTRGLYGGSLWLEPSFHGLQWPYMPKSGVGLSGYVWADNGYETINREQPAVPSTKQWVQQARAALRTTPTYSDGSFFVQGQFELVGNKDQVQTQAQPGSGIVDVDDLWVRVGTWNLWDVKVGRFEGWELYHTGMGLDINTIERRGATQAGIPGADPHERPDYYGVTYLHDRPNGQGVGDIALHVFPTNFVRVELLGQIGVDNYVSQGENVVGGRPAAILDLGWLKVKVGGEYVRKTKSLQLIVADPMTNMQVKQDSKSVGIQKGFGGTVQVVFLPLVEFGISGGVGKQSQTSDTGAPSDTAATTTMGVGAFINCAVGRFISPDLQDLLVGAGVNWTTETDSHRLIDPATMMLGGVDYTANLQAFGAVQYMVRRQLFLKMVVAYARSDFDIPGEQAIFSNTMWSGRLRAMYLF